MATSEQFLDNLLLFLAPLDEFPAAMDVRKDGIIETHDGCFATVYSRSTHATGLLWARHPHDLIGVSGTDSVVDAAHKGRLRLISMEELWHSRKGRWHPHVEGEPAPIHLDLTWLSHKVPRIAHKLSRAFMREATLQRIGRNTSVSAFVAYESLPTKNQDVSRIRILTKLDRNYCVPELAERIDPALKEERNSQHPLKKLWRQCADKIFSRDISDRFALCVKNANGEDYTCLPSAGSGRTVTADFAVRLKEIASGCDPVRWHESPVMPLLRVEAALAERLEELKPSAYDFSWEEMIRRSVKLGYHILVEEKVQLVLNMLADFAAEKIGLGERLTCVPHNWQKLVKRPKRRLARVDSDLHRLLHIVDPEQCRDLEWVRFDGGPYIPHFAGRTELLEADPARTFKNWLVSLFHAPFGPTFAYRDDQGGIVNPITEMDRTRVIQVQNELMQMHYDTHGQKLYAYYHTPEFDPANRKLPVDAPDYLKEGQVVMVDFSKRGCPMSFVPFDDFRDLMRAIGKPEAELPEPQTPMNRDLDTMAPAPLPLPPPREKPPILPLFCPIA